jgi:hypothetical protein
MWRKQRNGWREGAGRGEGWRNRKKGGERTRYRGVIGDQVAHIGHRHELNFVGRLDCAHASAAGVSRPPIRCDALLHSGAGSSLGRPIALRHHSEARLHELLRFRREGSSARDEQPAAIKPNSHLDLLHDSVVKAGADPAPRRAPHAASHGATCQLAFQSYGELLLQAVGDEVENRGHCRHERRPEARQICTHHPPSTTQQ